MTGLNIRVPKVTETLFKGMLRSGQHANGARKLASWSSVEMNGGIKVAHGSGAIRQALKAAGSDTQVIVWSDVSALVQLFLTYSCQYCVDSWLEDEAMVVG